MYEALDIAGAKPSDRVGVIGLGGLGHLAVQYAKAWGCDPVVFSRDADKRDDAIKLGAKEFHVVSQGATLNVKNGVDILLLCGGALPDFQVCV